MIASYLVRLSLMKFQMNMARAELLGWGAQVTFPNLTESSLSWALNEVLGDDRYKRNIQAIAERLLDQPQTAMDKAIFWIEYVFRHDGATFMQSSAKHLNHFEYNNLDIYATFALIVFLAVFIPIYIIKKLLKLICRDSSTQKTKKKRN